MSIWANHTLHHYKKKTQLCIFWYIYHLQYVYLFPKFSEVIFIGQSICILRIVISIVRQGIDTRWIKNFQVLKLDLEKAEEPEIKLPTSIGS